MTDENNEILIDGMDYSEWLGSKRGAGEFMVKHALAQLNATIEKQRNGDDSPAHDLGMCIGELARIHRQCARWRMLAAMQNVFGAYPGLVDTMGANIETPLDGVSGFMLMVNNDHYDPGDGNEFCVDTMLKLDEVDGLEAVNYAYDCLALMCADEHPRDEIVHVLELSSPKTQSEIEALMAIEAPELNARVHQLWMRQATPAASKPGKASPRM